MNGSDKPMVGYFEYKLFFCISQIIANMLKNSALFSHKLAEEKKFLILPPIPTSKM